LVVKVSPTTERLWGKKGAYRRPTAMLANRGQKGVVYIKKGGEASRELIEPTRLEDKTLFRQNAEIEGQKGEGRVMQKNNGGERRPVTTTGERR